MNEVDLATEMAKSREEVCEQRALCQIRHGDAVGQSHFVVLRIWPFDHLLRRERFENEPHFQRFRSFQTVKSTQAELTSFMSSCPCRLKATCGPGLTFPVDCRRADLQRGGRHGDIAVEGVQSVLDNPTFLGP